MKDPGQEGCRRNLIESYWAGWNGRMSRKTVLDIRDILKFLGISEDRAEEFLKGRPPSSKGASPVKSGSVSTNGCESADRDPKFG
jgi:hypothetical protein